MTSQTTTRPRSVVVTGGARGNGRAITRGLVDHGDWVVVVDLGDATETERLSSDQVGMITGSASDTAITERPVALARSRGPVVGWVNNAAVFRDVQLLGATSSEFLEQVSTNLL